MRAEIRDAETAASVLQVLGGTSIDWEPGDMTRYEVALVEERSGRALVLLNFDVILRLPAKERGPEPATLWIPSVPKGSWAGLRPLLAALGAAEGPLTYRREDSRVEADVRRWK